MSLRLFRRRPRYRQDLADLIRSEWSWEPVDQVAPFGPRVSESHVMFEGLYWRFALLGWIEAFYETGPFYYYALRHRFGAGSWHETQKAYDLAFDQFGEESPQARRAAAEHGRVTVERCKELIEEAVIGVLCGNALPGFDWYGAR